MNEDEKSLLRISTAGSVDDGKSTLIGRLLYDCKNVFTDHLSKVSKDGSIDFAMMCDGLKSEQEQGITIDVAYKYFSTLKRNFILADTPGHTQYTRNMATGASTANVSIIIIDAKKGITEQTKRHAFIASLLGIPRIVVAINKMDLVNWDQNVYKTIKKHFEHFSSRLNIKNLYFVPVSALLGDNIVNRSENMSWYHGEAILPYLEDLYTGSDENLIDFRFGVQYVIRPNQEFRGFAGKIRSGSIAVGETIVALPSMEKAKVKTIELAEKQLERAFAPMSITLTLDKEIDISRGEMVARVNNCPKITKKIEANLIWMHKDVAVEGDNFHLVHSTKNTTCTISKIRYSINVNTLSRFNKNKLELNDISRVTIETTEDIFVDSYLRNKNTGSFIIIDKNNFSTVGAGMIIETTKFAKQKEPAEAQKNIVVPNRDNSGALYEATSNTNSKTIWLTGLSGSGKSTLSAELEKTLKKQKLPVIWIDGDLLRSGLCKDLGFSIEDRFENVRRAAEIAKVSNLAGSICIVSLISPMKNMRLLAKEIIGEKKFIEVFVNTPIAECVKRDPKGLYAKAQKGEISKFTGVGQDYESPENPNIEIDTSKETIEDSLQKILSFLKK
jgi:bifunctional enzyme CysN/CysC